jgi:uncharacterized protein (TIGR02246 family)
MTSRAEDAASIRRLEQSWCSAWNSHDMQALTNLLAIDVDFVTVGGDWLRGRKEFRRHHALLHATLFKHSTFTVTGSTIKFLGPDLALTHIKWTLVGDFDPDGTPRKPRRGIFTQVLVRLKGRWCILASHNTNWVPWTTPRGKSIRSLLRPRDWK